MNVIKDLKYITANLVPAAALVGIYLGSWWTYSTVFLVFGLIPILEPFGPRSLTNYSEAEKADLSKARLFDWLLYLNFPILYGILWYYFQTVSQGGATAYELVGMVLTVGIVIGSCGINIAHELGHRSATIDRRMAEFLLLPALYLHFYLEHNRGHHRNVATDKDPASARQGENLYRFWFKTLIGSYLSAWKIQMELLGRKGEGFWSVRNDLLVYQLIQIGYLAIIAWYWGISTMMLAVAAGLVGALLLETINYIEHYGLRRKKVGVDRYERVKPKHSWNANYQLGRIMLYELTRHSDHHYLASKKYQILEHHQESPELPFGYPTSMLIAMCPPLWFSLMDPKIPVENDNSQPAGELKTADSLIQN